MQVVPPGRPKIITGPDLHGRYRPMAAYFASVASFCGRHHASLARYQSIVAASPSRKPEKRGVQPSSVRSFVESIA